MKISYNEIKNIYNHLQIFEAYEITYICMHIVKKGSAKSEHPMPLPAPRLPSSSLLSQCN